MIWGGQKQEKNSTATRSGKKKNSTQQPGIKTHQPVDQEKQNLTQILCPRAPQIINGLSLSEILLKVKHIFVYYTTIENSCQTAIKIEKFLPPVIFAPDTFLTLMSAKWQEYASFEVKI